MCDFDVYVLFSDGKMSIFDSELPELPDVNMMWYDPALKYCAPNFCSIRYVALSEAERSTAAKTDFQEIELSARKLKSFEN